MAEVIREESGKESRGISRRKFLKYAGIGGAVALGGVGGYFAIDRILRGAERPRPPWELTDDLGRLVVDYDKVPMEIEDGATLRIAQWYDYWPSSLLFNFEEYIREKYGKSVDVHTYIDYFTSNEELFTWITVGRRRYEVMFPSSYYSDLMNKAGLIYNINLDWIPNYRNLDPAFVKIPADSPMDYREDGSAVAVPYFFGTTGMAFRTDIIDKEDAEEKGWDFFWMTDKYRNSRGEEIDWNDAPHKLMLLYDQRDVFTTGFKKAGWEDQKSRGLEPSSLPPPFGEQWTSNETDGAKVNEAYEYLVDAKRRLFDFNSTQQGTYLANKAVYLDQGWSGDILNAINPYALRPAPIEYIVPKQGSTWWIDGIVLHKECGHLLLAHEFINFIHDPGQNVALSDWNLYPTPNAEGKALLPEIDRNMQNPSGYKPWEDERLYPPEDIFKRCDMTRDVGLNVLQTLYNPLWEDLTSGV